MSTGRTRARSAPTSIAASRSGRAATFRSATGFSWKTSSWCATPDHALAPLSLYDNLHRTLRPFAPLVPGAPVGLYTCGPTVYDYQHIGNYRTFMFEDTLKRALEWNGHQVNHVMNITDVGHLTSDADTGEDKMEKGARRTGRTAWEIAELYTDAFIDDMARLNMEMPSVLSRATDHIQDQIEFIVDIE